MEHIKQCNWRQVNDHQHFIDNDMIIKNMDVVVNGFHHDFVFGATLSGRISDSVTSEEKNGDLM